MLSSVLAAAAILTTSAVCLAAEGGAAPAAAKETVVLDTAGFWRAHHRLQPPVIAMPSGPLTVSIGMAWAEQDTGAAPAGWTAPDFDDSSWFRGPARRSIQSPYLSRLSLRGRFLVSDPAKVDGLRLTVGYHGGAVVYFNGKELKRGNLPEGALAETTMADAYPPEAFVTGGGAVIGFEDLRTWWNRPSDAGRAKLALQERTLADIAVPRDLLRKGVNVVAVEVFRSPYDKVIEEKKGKRDQMKHPYILAWNTCEITQVRLVATEAAGLTPAATRPAGMQAWNSDAVAADFDTDFGDPAEELRPVRLVTARNGAVNGKVVVGSAAALADLKATASELKGAGGVIPASAVQLRAALPWGEEHLTYPYSGQVGPYPADASPMGLLVDLPVAEVPVRKPRVDRTCLQLPGQPAPVFGAVAPIWITVRVPKEAAAGVYEGRITVEAKGEKPVVLPVRLEVSDWTIGDPKDWKTWVEIVESPDTLAMEYKLDPWSPKHLEMIGRSFDIMRQVGSGVVYVPLIARTHFGNENSMVKWVKGADGKYEFDFSAMDAYLDAAEKHLGKPKIVCFQVWDVYMIPLEKPTDVREDVRVREHLAKNSALVGKGPAVTVVDAATKKAEVVYLPRYEEANAVALWKPLFDQLRQKMAKRGLEKAMMLGLFPDVWATKGEVAALKEASGNLPWVVQSHTGASGKDGIYNMSSCLYQSRVWLIQHPTEKMGSLHGWRRPDLLAMFDREIGFINLPYAVWRSYPEFAITGDQRGVARLGGEFWEVLRDKQGNRKATITAHYQESSWRNLDPWAPLLAPAADGPVASTRFEIFRQGVENCEARIAIEQALLDAPARQKLGDDLARRCEAALSHRMTDMFRARSPLMLTERHGMDNPFGWGIAGQTWFAGSPWQDREKLLFDLAGEVRKKTK